MPNAGYNAFDHMDEPDENNIEREVTEVRLFYVQILENNFLTASESDS
jgi:hypothetical protein